MRLRWPTLPVVLSLVVFGCLRDNPAFDDPAAEDGKSNDDGSSGGEANDVSGDGDGDGDPGDGDGEPGDGDGAPGDGEPGDGDGQPGDGDGDGQPGDGDGEPLVCQLFDGNDACTTCLAESCCNEQTAVCLLNTECRCMLQCMALNGNVDLSICVEDCAPADDLLMQIINQGLLACAILNCAQSCQ